MKKTRATLAPSVILPNKGQLGWLPKNPRKWTKKAIDGTSRSIEEDPDFLEDRPVLVTPKDDSKYIAFAGNLRYAAAKSMALASVPVVIYLPETDEDRQTIKRRAAKDNVAYGEWDFDILANEWDDQPLSDWGVPAWDVNSAEEEVTDNDKEPGYNIQYVLVFNNEDEQDRWYAFLEWLKARYPDVDTISERVLLETDKLQR